MNDDIGTLRACMSWIIPYAEEELLEDLGAYLRFSFLFCLF